MHTVSIISQIAVYFRYW